MTIQLELEPEVEEKISALAAAEGIDPIDFVRRAVAVAAGIAVTNKAPYDVDASNAWLEELTGISDGYRLPYPDGETYSREMIYADQPKTS